MATILKPRSMHAGNKKVFRFRVLDLDAAPLGNGSFPPLDLTEFTAKWTICKPGLATPVLEKAATISGAAIDGIFEVTLLEADTDDLIGKFTQQLELYHTADSDASNVVAEGPFAILLNQVEA